MKILQLISYFAPAWAYGGSVRAVYEISKRLVKKGHQVTVVTTDVLDERSRVKGRQDQIEGIKVYYFPTISNWLSWHFKGFISPKMYFFLDKNIKDYNIVHLHEFYTFQGIITHHLCQKHKVPYIFSGHGSVLPTPERGKKWVKKFYTLFWGNKIMRDASSLIALTQKERKEYLAFKRNSQKIQVIPNGIDLDAFRRLPPKGRFKKKQHLPPDEKIILFVGRIYPVKGLDLLIKGVAPFLKKEKKTTIVIVGPDAGSLPDLKNLTNKLDVEEKVLFPGYLDGDEKLAAFVDANLYVQPSRSEGFPVSVLEAAACGLPLVVTKQSNIPEVANFQAGIVVDAKAKELGEAVITLLKEKKLRRKMGDNAKRMVQEKFNWDNIIDQLEKIYEDTQNYY